MTRPGFTVCVCPDSQLAKNRIDSLLASNPSPDGTWERFAYWGDEGLPPAFWENLTLQGLFASPKALIIRNAQNLPIDTWRKLSTSLAGVGTHAWPFICMEGAFDRGKPKIPKAISKLQCWAFAEKQGWIWQSAGLDSRSLREFVTTWATQHGIAVSPPVLQTLSLGLPADASAATAELEKLALAAGDQKEITQELAATVSHETDMDIFAFISALQSGRNVEKVWSKVISSNSGSDGMIFPFIAMLLREARILWQIKSGEQVRLPMNVLRAKEQLAKSLGKVRLAKIWDLALEADKGIKTGQRSPEQAMELLVAGLISVFNPKTHA